MKRSALLVAVVILAMAAVGVGTAGAITFGQPDGNRHPNVGALLADFDDQSPGPTSSAPGR